MNSRKHFGKIEVYHDKNALTRAAAERIIELLNQRLREKERATLVLTGGKTPEPVYRLLALSLNLEPIDWSRVHFFWGDERCVHPESRDSNFGMAWHSLISKLHVPSGHIHRMIGEMPDAETAASLYETEIRSVLPGTGIPSFDLVLLGMGEDGHVASLFPGTHLEEERLVMASQVPATGAKRISMTPRLLNESRNLIFIVAGSSKAKALAEVLEGNRDLPAAMICPVRDNLIWMTDQSAASLISGFAGSAGIPGDVA